MIDHAYLAELQAVRTGTYASLPNGLHIMAAVDARDAMRQKAQACAPEGSSRNTLPSMSAVEAVLAEYRAARSTAISGRGSKPGAMQANMRRRLARNAH